MKEFDFTQIKHYKLYNFIKAVFRPLVKLVFKAKFKGLENVPQDKGMPWARCSSMSSTGCSAFCGWEPAE